MLSLCLLIQTYIWTNEFPLECADYGVYFPGSLEPNKEIYMCFAGGFASPQEHVQTQVW